MRKLALSAIALVAVPALAGTADDQAYFAIFAETKVMKMPGMPEMPELPPGVKLPPGVVLPGRPSRQLTVRLWSPSIAPDNATASVVPPDGLKVGKKMDLEIYRPKATDGQPAKGGDDAFSNP